MELDRLATVLRYLQRKALIDKKVYCVQLHKKSYQAEERWTLPNGYFGVLPGIKGPPAEPTHEVKSGIKEIVITPAGIGPGTVYLTDGIHQYALTIDVSEVRRMRMYRYGSQWERLDR